MPSATPRLIEAEPALEPTAETLRAEAVRTLHSIQTYERSYFSERDAFTDDLRNFLSTDELNGATPEGSLSGRCADGRKSPLPQPRDPKHRLGCQFEFSVKLVTTVVSKSYEIFARRADCSGYHWAPNAGPIEIIAR